MSALDELTAIPSPMMSPPRLQNDKACQLMKSMAFSLPSYWVINPLGQIRVYWGLEVSKHEYKSSCYGSCINGRIIWDISQLKSWLATASYF